FVLEPVDCRFFFSSRRRHTRFSRDWSSDVCSSDLLNLKAVKLMLTAVAVGSLIVYPLSALGLVSIGGKTLYVLGVLAGGAVFGLGFAIAGYRSEEHTSELQSRENLVCRLLPEQKKIRPERCSEGCSCLWLSGLG